jgi:tetratricopeptide (TPR) repeat protein
MLTMNDIQNISDSFIHLEEFVDRIVETNQFQALVDKRYEERDAHKRIVVFYGQAGIGKTMLLDRLEFECMRKKVAYSRINFETGIYNNTIEILREIVQKLGVEAFNSWTQLDRQWFSSELDIPELNINVRSQEAGFNVTAKDVNISASGDMVAGSKVEIKNNTINISTRAALDPLGAQNALTESFIKVLGEFVEKQPAVFFFEGLDHDYCSVKTRTWIDSLLDKIRVLKGFGVLPIVTYFNSPNQEAKLRSVTFKVELKPLAQEHVIEYFRARRIPENIIVQAARSCIEETQGIPARVYEYTENIISALDEKALDILEQSMQIQIEEIAEQPKEVKESLQEMRKQSADIVDTLPSVTDSVEAVQENIPSEAVVEESIVIERQPEDAAETHVEEQSIAEAKVSEPAQQVEESPEPVAQVQETIPSEDFAPIPETAQPVEEEVKMELEAVTPAEEHFKPVEVESSQLEESKSAGEELLKPIQSTPEEADRSEGAFRRSQEKLQRLKSEGKNSTTNMLDSLLARQSDEIADAARRCAVLRWFNVDLIGVTSSRELKPKQAEEILGAISSWPFVQNFGYGNYAYRNEVQHTLRAQMQTENPELYTEINSRAHAYFDNKLPLSNAIDEMIWVNLQTEQITALRENLYYLLQVDVARGFDLLGQLFQSAQRLYLPGEAAILLKFANEVDKSTLGENYINLLTYYEAALGFSEGDAVSAESKLLTLIEKALDNELSAQVQGQLGAIYAAGGKYDEAIKSFEQAQKIWQKLQLERKRAKLSNNLGNVYMRKNDLGRAERSFNDALDGLKKAGTSSEQALTLNNLGNVYMKQENLSKALEYYQKSLEIKTSIGDQFGAANTYTNLGIVYGLIAKEASGKKQAEQRQLAVNYYTRSLETYRTFGARSNQGKLLFKLAVLYNEAGDKVKAKEYLPDALDIFRDLEMPDLENASKLEIQLG